MKKLHFLVFGLIIFGGWTYSQTPVSWTDNFDDNDLDTVYWKANPDKYALSEGNGELTLTVTKESMWDGFNIKFPMELDLSENPYASMKIKADTSLNFRLYLWDENEIDTLYNRADANVWVVPGTEYNTYYFNWSGKFLHASTDEDGNEVISEQDSTSIDGILINVEPGISDPLYQGTIVFEDVMFGAGAEIPFADAQLTGATIGSIGATVLSDIPEGTAVDAMLTGLTHNGDDMVLLAAGFPGKAGVEASGSDIVESSMDLVVLLEGSNPRKYDLLVAPPALPCYYREDFPTIDAEIDPVWETVPVIDMAHVLNGTVDGPTDLGATFRVLWDEVSLFILAEVKDDIEFVDNVSDAPWTDDAVEFWMDLNNSKNSSYLPSETDEFQFVFSKGVTNSYTVHHHDQIDGMDWAWANSQGGYIFEIEIPWLTSLEWLDRFGTTTPDFGHKLGFEIHVNDDDDGAEREANIGWFNPVDAAWNDPSALGDMKLMEEIEVSVEDENRTSDLKIRIKPNPATESLQLISNGSISHVNVVNLIGQSVMSLEVGNVRVVDLDVGALSNSIYLVTVRDQQGNTYTSKFIKK